MSEITLTIDGKKVTATEDMTLLDAAKSVGIEIPTLCHHKKLEPFGSCRLCTVELDKGSWKQLVVSCVYTVEAGLTVNTRSEKLDRIPRIHKGFPNSPRSTVPTRTASTRRPPSAYIAVSASGTAQRSSRRTQ